MFITDGVRKRWLVTGVAGFIGSNLLEALLKTEQAVTGVDDFSTGHRRNLDQVQAAVSAAQWQRFRFMNGDICDPVTCHTACAGVDFVLHQAALGSVPRSLENPIASHASNVTGFLNLLVAARDAGVKRFIYASSSAVYGDSPTLPKSEEKTGRCLSPVRSHQGRKRALRVRVRPLLWTALYRPTLLQRIWFATRSGRTVCSGHSKMDRSNDPK